MIVNIKKDISNDLTEVTVAAHQSGEGYRTISKKFGVNNSTVREIIDKWKTSKTADILPRKMIS